MAHRSRSQLTRLRPEAKADLPAVSALQVMGLANGMLDLLSEQLVRIARQSTGALSIASLLSLFTAF